LLRRCPNHWQGGHNIPENPTTIPEGEPHLEAHDGLRLPLSKTIALRGAEAQQVSLHFTSKVRLVMPLFRKGNGQRDIAALFRGLWFSKN
jgi:hypothetical protein